MGKACVCKDKTRQGMGKGNGIDKGGGGGISRVINSRGVGNCWCGVGNVFVRYW